MSQWRSKGKGNNSAHEYSRALRATLFRRSALAKILPRGAVRRPLLLRQKPPGTAELLDRAMAARSRVSGRNGGAACGRTAMCVTRGCAQRMQAGPGAALCDTHPCCEAEAAIEHLSLQLSEISLGSVLHILQGNDLEESAIDASTWADLVCAYRSHQTDGRRSGIQSARWRRRRRLLLIAADERGLRSKSPAPPRTP